MPPSIARGGRTACSLAATAETWRKEGGTMFRDRQTFRVLHAPDAGSYLLGFADATWFPMPFVKLCPSLILGCFEGPIAGWTAFTLPGAKMIGDKLSLIRERVHLMNHCDCGCCNR